MAIVLLGAIAFLILAARRQTFWIGVMVLASVAALDALLFLVVPRVTVCYRCRKEFRGPLNPEHGGWDLAVGEKYRAQKAPTDNAT
jgi:hypothetical protein